MAREPTTQPPDETPAGAPAEQKAVDRRWKMWAGTAVGSAVLAGGLIGFVLIPAAQKSGAHLTMGHAMARAAGLAPGSPAVPQPINTASPIPVSTANNGCVNGASTPRRKNAVMTPGLWPSPKP